MAPKSNVPIRICGSKTRSGCKICKQRHLKCDETRPTCLRCAKAERQCSYDHAQSISNQLLHAATLEDAAASMTVSTTQFEAQVETLNLPWSVSPYGPYDTVEVNAIESFINYLGKDLAGCFSNEVWCEILPRVAQHEPTIWHALVAVGMLDSGLRSGRRPEDITFEVNAAIKHYSRSIRTLNERLESVADIHCKDVVLLSCMLFAVFECLQNHHQSALRHITGGTRLLMAWEDESRSQNQSHPGIYLNHRNLQPIFLALDSQAVQLGAVDFRDHYVLPALENGLQIPETFESTQAAHVALNFIFNRLARWTGCNEFALNYRDFSKGSDDLEKENIRAQLSAWDSAFAVLSHTAYSQAATRLLIVQKKIMQIFFEKSAAGPSEIEWDAHTQAFAEVTTSAEAYMDLVLNDWRSRKPVQAPRGASASKTRPVLSMAMDIVLSLYLISVKCRNSTIRKRGLKMLKACGRREGIWDSAGCAAVAEKIIEIEEKEALPDGLIPESARIYMLDIRFGENEMEEIMYKKLVPDPTGFGYVEVTIQ